MGLPLKEEQLKLVCLGVLVAREDGGHEVVGFDVLRRAVRAVSAKLLEKGRR